MPKKAASKPIPPPENGKSVLPDRRQIPTPVFRRLRVFAVDPGLTAQFSTAVMNEMTLSIHWEPLKPGPVGEYLEVVDRDERDKLLNAPVDLDDAALLGMDGHAPSDGNAQFRHQMVYAVAMRTIRNFERALGRPAQWPPRKGASGKPVYTRRLEIRPHFYNVPNAYYDHDRGLFCFGYGFSANNSPNPGTTVFTCLSQDVIAHELSHALLMGMNLERYYSGRADAGALHEAFADIIALFQHFWISD
ncbi:MAG: peptidase S8, partial [Gemmatimonadaceae bacterium]